LAVDDRADNNMLPEQDPQLESLPKIDRNKNAVYDWRLFVMCIPYATALVLASLALVVRQKLLLQHAKGRMLLAVHSIAEVSVVAHEKCD
jgi:hypothetical protein